jgi:hypothetical protein
VRRTDIFDLLRSEIRLFNLSYSGKNYSSIGPYHSTSRTTRRPAHAATRPDHDWMFCARSVAPGQVIEQLSDFAGVTLLLSLGDHRVHIRSRSPSTKP